MIRAALRKRFERWLARRHPAAAEPVTILRERLYILPSGYGYFFALTLFVLFLWSINYNNSMGFILTFLLAAIALNAMWRSHENLNRLVLRPAEAAPVFAGQQAHFVYQLANFAAHPRHSVALQWPAGEAQYADVPAQASATVSLALAAARRGWLRPGRVRVSTPFPLGLFRAWTWQEFTQACLVYPKPAGTLPLPIAGDVSAAGHTLASAATGRDDYAGLRGYVPGDSPRHVAWKASARGNNLLVKHFAGQAVAQIWLDWQLLGAQAVEARLSQLCQWVLKAEEAGYDYGLRLPGCEFAPSRGAEHRSRCLRALALFETGQTRG
jgi:uncharacterized protein (DUF58 family)